MPNISVTYMDHLGTDLTIVNAARVTMGVSHEELNEKDTRLLRFLARENHRTPFRHAQVSFRCSAPIAIARQLGKHQVGFSWNEMSRRYKDGAVECFIPETIFKRPDNLHSGSGVAFEAPLSEALRKVFAGAYHDAVTLYESLLDDGVAPEQARFVLPQGMVTEWVWTGSLYGWAELCRQRLSSHAQYEVRLFAQQIAAEMKRLYPIAWEALMENMLDDSHEDV